MSKYLVVDFDRYNTSSSINTWIEADSFVHALTLHLGNNKEELDFLMELFEEVNEVFACVSLEESDILIYKV